jgi:hypothetical protein
MIMQERAMTVNFLGVCVWYLNQQQKTAFAKYQMQRGYQYGFHAKS